MGEDWGRGSGIHIPKANKKQLKSLSSEILALVMNFNHDLLS